jgi:hypothetical protein
MSELVLPPFIKNLFAGGVSTVMDSVKGVIEQVQMPGEQKRQLSLDLEKLLIAHKEKEAEQQITILTQYLNDVQSARNMQVEALKQSDLFSKRFVYILAIVVILLTFGYDYYILFNAVPTANKDFLNIVAGSLNTGCLATIIGFFFGSSKGSDDKNKVIENIATNQ